MKGKNAKKKPVNNPPQIPINLRVKNFKNIEYFLLATILFLGFIVRLYKVNNPVADWHSWRQADTASVSKTFFERGINLLYPRYHELY